MTTSVSRPNELSEAEIQQCIALIAAGDAVNLQSAEEEFPLAEFVAVEREGERIVGVATIKRQRPWYVAHISEQSGIALQLDMHEFGYVSVSESYSNRGISARLTKSLLEAFPDRPLFATTSNPWMKRTLEKACFKQTGTEWKGKKVQLSLWMLEAALR